MWDAKKSILLSKLCICCFMALFVLFAATAPMTVKWIVWYTTLRGREAYLLCTIYAGVLPAVALLYDLYRLLGRISKDSVFVPENVAGLRRISWYCFLGCLICVLSGIYYFPFMLVALAAAFVGLIVRVVKNVFAQAILLKQEVDYTI